VNPHAPGFIAPTGGWVTRLAPSPTGRLHLGHLLHLVWLFGLAQRYDARVLLRIEDHDRPRCRPEYTHELLSTLQRLGIECSGGYTGAQPDPYRQSDNPQRYVAALDTLRNQGRLYACACSRSELRQRYTARGIATAEGQELPYDGHCRHLGLPETADVGLRAWLDDQPLAFDDMLLNTQLLAPIGDPLLRDRTGLYTYTLCVVADDLAHGINLVVRGFDLLPVTGTQLALRQLLGPTPELAYAHHPLITDASGRKLSKSDGDGDVAARLDAGATPGALFAEATRRGGRMLLAQDTLSIDEFAAAIGAGRKA